MIGVELNAPCSKLLGQALEAGLLCSIQAERVIRLLPPLTLSDEEADLIIDRLATLILTFSDQQEANHNP